MSDEKRPGTPPTQFRLKEETLTDLDVIAKHHSDETGREMKRADAVRIAARKEADRIRKLSKKSPK